MRSLLEDEQHGFLQLAQYGLVGLASDDASGEVDGGVVGEVVQGVAFAGRERRDWDVPPIVAVIVGYHALSLIRHVVTAIRASKLQIIKPATDHPD